MERKVWGMENEKKIKKVYFTLTGTKYHYGMDFLEKGKTYRAVIYADGKDADWVTNPTAYEIIEKQVTATDILSVNMAKGGGQAITFMPF